MIDKVLFELLGEFGAKHFEVFLLLACFDGDFDNFLVDVATEECGALRRVLLRLFYLFQDLAHAAFLALFDLLNLAHDIFEQVLNEHLGLFITIQALVYFNTDHLTKLISDLRLVVLEAIDFIPD